jgi:REP element-mobilizing transposase RayT
MPRRPRIQFPGGLYHVICRGNNRERIFRDDADRKRFLALLRRYRERWHAIIHAYVLMPNHMHLLVETPSRPLSEFMRGLNTAYTMAFNRRHRRVGHVFQGRYRSHVVEKDAYLLELTRYLHLNPVRAGLVTQPERYLWSSYREFLGQAPAPSLSDPDTALAQLGRTRSQAVPAYRRFVREGIRSGNLRGEFPVVEGQFIGSDRFAEEVERGHGRRQPRQTLKRQSTAEDILQALAADYGLSSPTALTTPHPRATAPLRDTAMYLVHLWTGLPITQMASTFGIRQSAASLAVRRGEALLQRDTGFQRAAKGLASRLGLPLPRMGRDR